MVSPLLPAEVADGFIRDDMVEEYTRDNSVLGACWLFGGCIPHVGQDVKMQLNFRRKQRAVDGLWKWCLLGGKVIATYADDCVLVEVSGSTLNTPPKFDFQAWYAVLCYDLEFDFPWVLGAMLPVADPTSRLSLNSLAVAWSQGAVANA